MSAVYKCPNDRDLLISDRLSLSIKLDNSDMLPSVVLITAWDASQISSDLQKELIFLLLDRGCRYFVCVGTCAELLHDVVDDLVLEYEEIFDVELFSSVMTTYHDDEPLIDVVAFFVNATKISNLKEEKLVAILNINSSNDNAIRILLESMEGMTIKDE